MVSAEKPVADIPGICGIVKGAILPGFYGIEAGQSAVGDIFTWWVEVVCGGDASLHAKLTRQAAKLAPGPAGCSRWIGTTATARSSWISASPASCSARRCIRRSAEIYRTLIEATAFGARAIIERIREYGVPIDRIVCAGGIAEKNPLLMQIYADVTGCTMLVAGSSQACALGSAVSAAVLAGAHQDFASAQEAMTTLKKVAYKPGAAAQKTYNQLYALYRQLHDSLRRPQPQRRPRHVMKDLLAIKEAARN